MIKVSEIYKTLADGSTRNIDAKVMIGGSFYTSESIIDLNIYRSVGESGFSIGNTVSNHCIITLATKYRMKSGLQVVPYVRFKSTEESEWLKLGEFFITETKAELGRLRITAYDKMYTLDKRCTFLGTTSGSVSPVSFPCSIQTLLNYTCSCRGLKCDFKCQDFTVESILVANPKVWNDSRYYTHRQMLGYIAAAHGANALFDNEGKLVFKCVGGDAEYVEAWDCIDQNIDSEEPFTVNGVRLQIGENYIFINDTGDPYDEDMEGIIESSNPLGSIAVAEYIWKQLGGFSYCSCDFIRRGRGWIEPGDIININDSINSKRVNIVAGTIELSFSADTGFLEHIISEAETSAESGNRAISGSTGINTLSSDSNMAVYFSAGSGKPSIKTLKTNVVDVHFRAVEVCTPLFCATIPFEIKTAGTVTFYLIYDGVIVNTYNQICDVGKNFASINMPLVRTGNGGHNVNIWVSSEDAKGFIDGINTYASVLGSGLKANSAWDGTISFDQKIPAFTLETTQNLIIRDISTQITAKTQKPKLASFDISVRKYELTSSCLQLDGISESISADILSHNQELFTEQFASYTLSTPHLEFSGMVESVSSETIQEE